MNIEFINKVLPKLSVEDLQQLRTKIDFLLATKKVKKATSTEELLWKELVIKYNAQPFDKAGKNLITCAKKIAAYIDEQVNRWELNANQKRKLCRIILSATEDILKNRKETPTPYNILQMAIYANDILHRAYPGYYGSLIFKNFILGKV